MKVIFEFHDFVATSLITTWIIHAIAKALENILEFSAENSSRILCSRYRPIAERVT